MGEKEFTKADVNTDEGEVVYVEMRLKVRMPKEMDKADFRGLMDWYGITDEMRVYWEGDLTRYMTVEDVVVGDVIAPEGWRE